MPLPDTPTRLPLPQQRPDSLPTDAQAWLLRGLTIAGMPLPRTHHSLLVQADRHEAPVYPSIVTIEACIRRGWVYADQGCPARYALSISGRAAYLRALTAKLVGCARPGCTATAVLHREHTATPGPRCSDHAGPVASLAAVNRAQNALAWRCPVPGGRIRHGNIVPASCDRLPGHGCADGRTSLSSPHAARLAMARATDVLGAELVAENLVEHRIAALITEPQPIPVIALWIGVELRQHDRTSTTFMANAGRIAAQLHDVPAEIRRAVLAAVNAVMTATDYGPHYLVRVVDERGVPKRTRLGEQYPNRVAALRAADVLRADAPPEVRYLLWPGKPPS